MTAAKKSICRSVEAPTSREHSALCCPLLASAGPAHMWGTYIHASKTFIHRKYFSKTRYGGSALILVIGRQSQAEL